MEVYAGFLEHTDHHVGQLIDTLAELEALDDTLVYYIIGDNGALGRGDLGRHLQRDDQHEWCRRAGDDRVCGGADRQVRHPEAFNHYAVGWAHGHGHPLSVDQAGRLPLGRDPQRHHRPLARFGIQAKGESAASSPT